MTSVRTLVIAGVGVALSGAGLVALLWPRQAPSHSRATADTARDTRQERPTIIYQIQGSDGASDEVNAPDRLVMPDGGDQADKASATSLVKTEVLAKMVVSETRDVAWAREHEQAYGQAFPKALPGARVTRVLCAATICQVDVRMDDVSDASKVEPYLSLVRTHPQLFAGRETIFSDGDDGQTHYFVTRYGYTIPTADGQPVRDPTMRDSG